MIDRLIEKIKETNNPTVVGLDPRLSYIPEHIVNECYEKYGKTPKAVAEAFFIFNKEIIDATYDLIPAVKPQVAMYEMFGPEGMECYIRTIQYAKSKGLIIIGDIKRSDIASTAESYSDGHIGRVDIGGEKLEIYYEDFITLNPYLGIDSIEPYFNNCKEYERGMFVLVKTSNPNSGELQDLDVNGMKLYEKVGLLTEKWGEEFRGEYGYSSVGAVVGATHPSQAEELRKLMPHTFFLVPGYGAQGGKAEDLAVCFDENGLGAIINSSRGIISAYKLDKYKDKFSEKDFAKASRQAVIDMRDDLNKYRLK
ncbi:MAG: orotidine-5'-phosphate decarboxylase [Tyzzerella sp.]|uniref:Orotidine 5'-phosphate decarboxylase n=1 Tax=Candidatus Fimicola merdigallinarum TaxID=2840819 RepID=A0A9D9DVJ1_9FIRM|nr:orotidine-5'-phosphate decarboxylase [Candidatus Fimicola merdigallinarum]